MYLQIKSIILWPRSGEHQPRVVPFKVGTLNVITGVSKTGKSAIIPIIDYCLGSEKCAIPVDTIRRACSWFGVILDTPRGEMLLARREPGIQKATGDMFLREGASLEVPNRIEKNNTNVEGVKAVLNEIAGLTQLDFDLDESGSGFKGRPSFRDMTAFVFQPQNIIANANALFFKADSSEHREKLKTIFPYVLGAVTGETLALEHELRRLRFDLRRKEKELAGLQDLSAEWVAEVAGKVTVARELGLVSRAIPADASIPIMIGLLREAIDTPVSRSELSPQILTQAAEELVTLEREEASASASLSRLKKRFGDMTRFREATQEYSGSLSVRRDRLQISDWIRHLYETENECPLCGADGTATEQTVRSLYSALVEIESQADSLSVVPAAFDREYQRVREDIGRHTERLNAIKRHREVLGSDSEDARRRHYEATSAARFLGSLEESLYRYDKISSDSTLVAEVSSLRERISEIEKAIRNANVQPAIARAVQRFALLAGRILPNLDTEWPNDPLILVPDDLTVKVVREGREDYLWEIGSGANWLAYHIATSIALHEFFRDLKASPVPSFVVYDQPSQVYFPKGINAGIEALNDEDVSAVRKVFRALADAAIRGNGAWQAIVLDHASDDIWGDIPGLHKVEEWRGGLKLVPTEWLE